MALKSKQWFDRHKRDPFVKQAQQQGYRSRAAYKLLQLDKKERLFRSGMCVVDLGAAPGGWSQVAKERVGAKGRVYALDRLAMTAINGVEFIQGDFTEQRIVEQFSELLGGRAVDAVISDMAPNLTGNRCVDEARSLELAQAAMQWAEQVLAPGGIFLVKLFEGSEVKEWIKGLESLFSSVKRCKPSASRQQSAEFYCLAKGFSLTPKK